MNPKFRSSSTRAKQPIVERSRTIWMVSHHLGEWIHRHSQCQLASRKKLYSRREGVTIAAETITPAPEANTLVATLNPPATSSEQKIKNHQQQNEIETPAAVISDTRAHVIPAAAEQHQENHENEYEWHARKSSTTVLPLCRLLSACRLCSTNPAIDSPEHNVRRNPSLLRWGPSGTGGSRGNEAPTFILGILVYTKLLTLPAPIPQPSRSVRVKVA